jgi:hypothetical protein
MSGPRRSQKGRRRRWRRIPERTWWWRRPGKCLGPSCRCPGSWQRASAGQGPGAGSAWRRALTGLLLPEENQFLNDLLLSPSGQLGLGVLGPLRLPLLQFVRFVRQRVKLHQPIRRLRETDVPSWCDRGWLVFSSLQTRRKRNPTFNRPSISSAPSLGSFEVVGIPEAPL